MGPVRADSQTSWVTNRTAESREREVGRTEKKRKFKVGLKRMLYYVGNIDMMTITSSLRTIHHRDTERTEDAQRKKKTKV
jgi:hypothetical protein